MIEFKNIKLKNFLSFRDQSFSFTNRGLVLVLGENNDSIYAGSNGSGKSALFCESIYYALFGRTLRGVSSTQVVSFGEKKMVVDLEFSVNGEEYRIIRGRNGSSSSLVLEHNGKDISRKDIRETQKVINEMIDPELMKSSIIFSGSVFESFVLLNDTQKKKIITNMIGLERIETAHEIVKQRLRKVDDEISNVNGRIEALENIKKDCLDELEQLNTVDIESKNKKLEESKKILDELKELEKKLYTNLQKVDVRISKIKNRVDELKEEKSSIQGEKRLIKVKIDNLQSRVVEQEKLLKDGRCPTCKELIPKDGVLSKDIEDFQKEIKILEDKLNPFYEREEKVSEALQQEEQKLSSSYEDKTGVESKYLECKKELEEFSDHYNYLRDELQEHKTKVDTLNQQLGKTEEEIKRLRKELNKLNEEREVYDFWVEGFGPRGIVSFILDGVFPKFNKVLNEYLQILFGTGIVARFVPFTTLKSGELREKWDFEIEGLGDYKSCSSGEKRRVDIAVLFALNSLVRDMVGGSNLLVVDEVFDPLDEVGAEKTIELLRNLDVESVIVITHNEALQEKFSNVMRIQKDSGVSRVCS